MSFLEFLKQVWEIMAVMLGGITIGALVIGIVVEAVVIFKGIRSSIQERKEKNENGK